MDEFLTTIDNPYDPFTQFDEWYAYDTQKNYHTCELLARFARTSDELTEKENNEEINRAILEILSSDFGEMYKVVREQKD